MATLSSPGVGSGLDVTNIISQLVAIERQPLTQLQTAERSLQSKISTYGKVKSSISALRDAAATLTNSSTWSQTTGTSSDATAVSVTTGAATKAGNYTLAVQRLASAQSNSTATFASASSTLGEGTLSIELGTWGAGQTSFTPKSGATALNVTIGPGAQTLEQVRDTINAAGAGVSASVLTDSSGARLVLRGSNSGDTNGFRIQVTDNDGNNTDAAGLSALAFDPSVGVNRMPQAQAAANALATLDSLSISSETNTLANVLDGMSLTLNKVTTAPVQVTAAQDSASMRKAMDTFVTAYNDLNKLLADQTKYDAATKTAGGLQGDSAAVSIRTQMRSVLGTSSGASTMFTRLSEVGFDLKLDGSLTLNEAKVNNALANVAETKKLFANSDIVTPGNDGIATRMRALSNQLIGVDGTVNARTEGLNKKVSLNKGRQDALNLRIVEIEKRLRAQYGALDRNMGQLSGLSNFVSQQFGVNNRN